MKAAVVYYSRSGITKKIAEKIQAKFGADMIFVEPEKAYRSFAGAILRVIREKKAKKTPGEPRKGGFYNFEQRNYDYDSLEKKLLSIGSSDGSTSD